jgi:hypothetical protein
MTGRGGSRLTRGEGGDGADDRCGGSNLEDPLQIFINFVSQMALDLSKFALSKILANC